MTKILELFNSIDTSIFLFLNGLHTSFFDQAAFLFSDKLVWIPFYLSILYIIIKYWKKDAIWIIIALLLSIVLADQIASGVLKPLVKRLRPSHTAELSGLIHTVNGYLGGKYGFVSSHAANSFALAVFCALLFKKNLFVYSVLLWASVNSYSRIYLGVHYPFDILGGAMVGVVSAVFCFYLLKRFSPKLTEKFPKLSDSKDNTIYQKVELNLPLLVLTITVIAILLYAL